MAEQELKDISIIGGGPTGLFAAFYAGMRGASARIIDALPALGGQLMALYPEKYIFDVAGFPKVLAKDLVRDMATQGLQFGASTHLGEVVTGLRRVWGGRRRSFCARDLGERVSHPDHHHCGRHRGVRGAQARNRGRGPLRGEGLFFKVLDPKVFEGQRVLLVGAAIRRSTGR